MAVTAGPKVRADALRDCRGGAGRAVGPTRSIGVDRVLDGAPRRWLGGPRSRRDAVRHRLVGHDRDTARHLPTWIQRGLLVVAVGSGVSCSTWRPPWNGPCPSTSSTTRPSIIRCRWPTDGSPRHPFCRRCTMRPRHRRSRSGPGTRTRRLSRCPTRRRACWPTSTSWPRFTTRSTPVPTCFERILTTTCFSSAVIPKARASWRRSTSHGASTCGSSWPRPKTSTSVPQSHRSSTSAR